jgi:rod shape-determining protein MreC
MVRIAALRAVAQRFSFALLMMAAIGLMMLGKVDAVLFDAMRARVTDAVAPILDAFSRPTAAVANGIDNLQSLARLREENARLRAENAALQQFQQAAYRLEAENLSLRALMNYNPEARHAFITGRVIAGDRGAFVRSLAISLGADHGVRDGQAVLGSRGLIGRIVQTGARSARLLLITDLNARIPVLVERSRHRAVLGGDNSDQPRLLHLPAEIDVHVGDRIVTSGHGRLFPAGLPVGIVVLVEEGLVRVMPLEDLDRLEYVRIVDFRAALEDAAMMPVPGAGW